MASRLSPYLTLDGTAKRAMEFYLEVFGGELKTVPDEQDGERLLHAQLDTPQGFTLVAWDGPAEPAARPAEPGSVYVEGEDEQLAGFFERLAEGGRVTMPLARQFWGDVAGALVDRFGVGWMFDITGR